MKLELRHLAPYLPYKLMVMVFNEKPKVMNASSSSSSNWVGIGACIKWSENCKPILRPLCDLSTIGVDGISINEHTINSLLEEKFNVDYGLFSQYKGELSIEIDGDPYLMYDQRKIISFEVIKVIFEELYRGHYDVEGLIQKGLAIDINTLEL